MTIRLYPAVVWALDDRAAVVARTWHAALDSDARKFVRVASSHDEAARWIDDFSAAGFATELRRVGVEPPEGIRVRIVLVAYVCGPDAFSDWRTTDTHLRGLESEVMEADVAVVGLARLHQHPRGDAAIKLEGLSRSLWLVTDRLHRGERLDEQRFQRACSLLLSGLTLAERVRGPGPSVFDVPEAPGHVCLLGIPGDNLQELAEELVQAAVLTVIAGARELVPGRPGIPAALLRGASERCGQVLSGSLLPKRFLSEVMGTAGGLASMDAGGILADGPGFLLRLADQLEGAASRLHTGPVVGAHTWLQRQLISLGRWQGLELAPPASARGPAVSDTERQFLTSRLRLASRYLAELGARTVDRRRLKNLPVGFRESWSQALLDKVRHNLRVLSEEVVGQPQTAADTIVLLADHVRPDVTRKAAQAMSEWGVGDEEARMFAGAIDNEDSMRFTGQLLGASPPRLHAVLASSELPARFTGGQILRFWPAVGYLVIGRSEPVDARLLER